MSQDETVELEMDELNQHECMANMTALLRHMQRNNITPKIEEVSQSQLDLKGMNIFDEIESEHF